MLMSQQIPTIRSATAPEAEGALTDVHFDFQWLDSVPVRNRPADATFAKLSIRVGAATVTSVVDGLQPLQEARVRGHVVGPVLSVAEWLVSNWWHLWYEVANTGGQRPEFESRHDLVHAGEGFLLPRLEMVPDAERVHLRWSRWNPEHANIEFVSEGWAVVSREALESEFRTLIEAVLARLRRLPGGTETCEFLSNDWEAINSMEEEEVEFAKAAALLGSDPFDVEGPVADAIVEFWETSQPSIREEVLASASEDSLSSVGQWLNDSLAKLEESCRSTRWSELRAAAPADLSAPPRTRGYALADRVRLLLDLAEGRVDFDQRGPLAATSLESALPCKRIQGLVATHGPTCIGAPGAETDKRYLLARALGDYIGRTDPGPGILSSLATDRQAQSRGFADQFLVPAGSIRTRLEGQQPDEAMIDHLATEFGVSSEVIRRQIENHPLAAR